MPIYINAAASQIHTAALAAFHDDAQQHPRLFPDPIGPAISNAAAAVALNPQPLPPAELGTTLGAHAGDMVAINPQPLPPREFGASLRGHAGDLVALNPQPLPPRWLSESLHASRFDAVALNPQPLPPKSAVFVRMDEYCGNGRHIPSVPPLPGPGPQER